MKHLESFGKTAPVAPIDLDGALGAALTADDLYRSVDAIIATHPGLIVTSDSPLNSIIQNS